MPKHPLHEAIIPEKVQGGERAPTPTPVGMQTQLFQIHFIH